MSIHTSKNLYALVGESVAQGQGVALATLVHVEGSTPREVGAKMVVYPDGRTVGTVGGGAMEAAVIRAALEAIAEGASRMLHYALQDPAQGDPGICGGAADVYIDVALPKPALLVVGAGHVAMPVAEIGHLCGFRVTVVDDRPDLVSEERFPHAVQRIAGDIVERLATVSITPDTYIVIVTRGHAYDEAALRSVLGSPAAYVGMIGSRRKVRTTFDRLIAGGADQDLIRRVHAPIGLDIGAQTPAEIAVSILAEMVMVRSRKHGSDSAPVVRSMKMGS
jgi:xanthine dehydrogenase accessory factor